MDIVQMANDFVLGLQRLGDFFKGYDALVNLGKFVVNGQFADKLDVWTGQLSGTFSSSSQS